MSEVKARACKHAVYVQAQDGSDQDAIFIKEYLHYDNGFYIEDYKRPFWVNYPQYRTYQDKRFEEPLNRLQKFSSTQRKLHKAVNKALGFQYQSLQMAASSPYVYGLDMSTPCLIKQKYIEQYPEYNGEMSTDNSVAALDIETDMFDDKMEPIMASLTMKDKGYIVIVESFFDKIPLKEDKVKKAIELHLADKIKKRNLKIQIEWVKDAGKACYNLIQKAHEWGPDILSIWNVNFDIKKIAETLELYGYNLAKVFSDPSVPEKYQYFRYREGKNQKVTASGKFMALHPAEQWHVVECPASFYVLDAMCVYLRLRIAAGKESSYKLDYILKKHGCDGKFVFEPAAHLKDAAWQRYMQENYKAEYCVYNLMDCIALEELDEKTQDLKRQISVMSGPSEYSKFSSQPRRICDDMFFELLKVGKAIGSTGVQMETENDKLTMDLAGWIVTLPSHLTDAENTVRIDELPDTSSKLHTHVADLDLAGTYPNSQILLNIGLNTTKKEICRIQGLSERQVRAFGINLTGGYVNAVELCCTALGAPTMERMLKDFNAHLSGTEPEPDRLSNYSDTMAFLVDDDLENIEISEE